MRCKKNNCELEVSWGETSLQAWANRWEEGPIQHPVNAERNDQQSRNELDINWGEVRLEAWADRWAGCSKQRTTNSIAITLVVVFGVTLTVLVAWGLFLITTRPTPEAEQVAHVVSQYMQTVRDFILTVFTPLLAFILGYYYPHRPQEAPRRFRGLQRGNTA